MAASESGRERPRRRTWVTPRLRSAAVAVALSGVVLVSCGGDTDRNPAARGVPIEMTDFAFGAARTLRSGEVTLDVQNNGNEVHQANFIRLNDGVTVDEFAESVAADLTASLSLGTMAGGAGVVQVGGSLTASIELQPGTYAMFCLLPSPTDGVPHLVKGMVSELEVSGPVGDAPSGALLPPADGEIELIDWAFATPSPTLTAGDTYRVANTGTQVHELVVAQLADGKTRDDALAFLLGTDPEATAPPFRDVAGAGWAHPGQQQNLTVDVPAGRYLLICYLPDPTNNNAPHFGQGMLQEISIVE